MGFAPHTGGRFCTLRKAICGNRGRFQRAPRSYRASALIALSRHIRGDSRCNTLDKTLSIPQGVIAHFERGSLTNQA